MKIDEIRELAAIMNETGLTTNLIVRIVDKDLSMF